MRSEGPFTVYNHHKARGDEFHDNAKLTKSIAKQRVQEQLDILRQRKEHERQLFKEQIQTEEENFRIQQQLKRLQHLENQRFVQLQIEARSRVRQHEIVEVKSDNTKAHYGPEETEEVHEHQKQRRLEQQEKVRNAYLSQMQLSSLDRRLEREIERAKDSKNLETILEM